MIFLAAVDILTRTGQVVDAVLMPVAPHAAVIPGKFYHGGKIFKS